MATGTGEAIEISEPREDLDQFQTKHLPREDQIRQRAHEIWWQRGDRAGSDVTDWLQAEEEIFGADRKVRIAVTRRG
jgi:hypothetical protein